MELAANIVGLIGVGAIVLAYGLLTAGKVSAEQLSYHLVNLLGAVLILLSLLVHFNLASFVIEIVWIAISLYGIWRVMRRA